MDKLPQNTPAKRVKNGDNPLHFKRAIKLVLDLVLKLQLIRKGLKVSSDTFAVLVVLMDSYVNKGCGLTRYQIYYGCGYKTSSGYYVMAKKLVELLDAGLIEVIGKRSNSFVYMPTKKCSEAFHSLAGFEHHNTVDLLLSTG